MTSTSNIRCYHAMF